MAYKPIEGKDVILYIMKGADYVPVVCIETLSVDFNKTTKETKTFGTGNWSRPRTQRNAYTINCLTLIPLGDDPADAKPFELLDYFMGDSEAEIRLVWTVDGLLKVLHGVVLVTHALLNGNATGFADGSFTMQGVGIPVLTESLDICDAEINESNPLAVTFGYEGTSGGNDTFLVQVTDVSGSPVAYNYSIDGGGTLTSYANPWYVSVATGSLHDITITPICSNGQPGVPYTKEFGLG